MSEAARTDIFVEDRAHEDFVCALLRRLAQEHGMALDMQVRSARGGHGRVLAELGVYQASVRRGILGLAIPDMLVVAIDANCKNVSAARREIREKLQRGFESLTAIACPAPHIERWYMADPPSFLEVVGTRPNVGRRKCQKDRYKKMLREAMAQGGHVPTLGGIEFAHELVNAMDLYRAGKAERSLKAFLDDLRSQFLRLAGADGV